MDAFPEDNSPADAVAGQPPRGLRFFWLRVLLRYLWYLLLLGLIIVLFQGPEKGFRYLGL